MAFLHISFVNGTEGVPTSYCKYVGCRPRETAPLQITNGDLGQSVLHFSFDELKINVFKNCLFFDMNHRYNVTTRIWSYVFSPETIPSSPCIANSYPILRTADRNSTSRGPEIFFSPQRLDRVWSLPPGFIHSGYRCSFLGGKASVA